MKSLALAFLFLAACNTTQSGANGSLGFTPTNCGVVAGCDFDMSVGVGGKIDITLDSLDGTPTAGLDLASRDPNLLSVTRTADQGGEPAWEITALGAGAADLAAVDTDGTEIDFVEVPMQDVTAVTMQPFVGSPVESTEAPYDQAFTVQALQDYSWFIRPLIGQAETMGRFDTETVVEAGANDATGYQTASSDPTHGYFYVNLEAGDFPIEFHLSFDFSNLYVAAMIHAVAP